MKAKILLVDDNIVNLKIGKDALNDIYDVMTVPSGERALYFLNKHQCDLILLDIDMPNMDGFETIRRIKKNVALSNIPVIFLSARDDAASKRMGLSLGAVDFMLKPFCEPLLKVMIEKHISLRRVKVPNTPW